MDEREREKERERETELGNSAVRMGMCVCVYVYVCVCPVLIQSTECGPPSQSLWLPKPVSFCPSVSAAPPCMSFPQVELPYLDPAPEQAWFLRPEGRLCSFPSLLVLTAKGKFGSKTLRPLELELDIKTY